MRTVVLVEDNPANQMVIQDICELDLDDVTLIRFDTAENALEEIPRIQPDLVLMDVGLPGMTGAEAAHRLKLSSSTHHIPIWAITAHAMKGDRESGLQTGFDEYLTKPIDSNVLCTRLRKILQARHKEVAA